MYIYIYIYIYIYVYIHTNLYACSCVCVSEFWCVPTACVPALPLHSLRKAMKNQEKTVEQLESKARQRIHMPTFRTYSLLGPLLMGQDEIRSMYVCFSLAIDAVVQNIYMCVYMLYIYA